MKDHIFDTSDASGKIAETIPELELISLEYCPYVQRTQIMLEHHSIPYKLTHIDPDRKPDWFHAVSPLGKVPVLRVDGKRSIFESTVINELIADFTDRSCLPADPVERAHCRSWIEYAGVCQSGLLKMVAAKDKEQFEEASNALATSITNVDAQLDAKGPYFLGTHFSLVDATYAPFFIRLVALGRIVPVPALSPRMTRWQRLLMSHKAVLASMPKDFSAVFERFIMRKGPDGHVDQLSRAQLGF